MQNPSGAAFASVVGLGAMKSDHTPTPEWRRKDLMGTIVMSLVALAIVAAGIGWLVYTSLRPGAGDSGFSFVLLCFGCVLLPIGAFGIFTRLRHWQVGAALYENGFAYKDSSGVRQVAWQDVNAVWQNITKHYRNGRYTGTTYVYTVQLRDGKKIVLDGNLAGIEQLGSEVARSVAAAIFPRYLQGLQSGQRLAFGPLAIDQQGIYNGSRSLLWSDIKALKIQQGVVSVKQDGGWFNWATARVPQIPNFYVFYDLVGRFVTIE